MADDTSDTLEEWKVEMQAEHEDAIENPNPEEDHRIECVPQVAHRVYFACDGDRGSSNGRGSSGSTSWWTPNCRRVPGG